MATSTLPLPDDTQPPPPHCPIHPDVELDVYKYENDDEEQDGDPWHFVKCSQSGCFVSCGLDRLTDYVGAIENKLHKWYKDIGSVVCKCGDHTRLAMSGSRDNPDRLYFCCRNRQCNYFQWADRLPRLSWDEYKRTKLVNKKSTVRPAARRNPYDVEK